MPNPTVRKYGSLLYSMGETMVGWRAGDAVQQEIFSGVHEFHGARGLPFLASALK